MKKLFNLQMLIIVFSLSMIPISAEVSPKEYSIYTFTFKEGTETYLFGDKVNIRNQPKMSSKVRAVLPIGTKIKITQKTSNFSVINGYKEFWYKISYAKNRSGYVWGGLIAMNYLPDGDYLILTSVNSFKKKEGLRGECRLVKKNRLLSSVKITPHYFDLGDPPTYGYRVLSKLHSDAKGLEDLDSVAEIEFQYEACGYPNGSVFLGRKKDQLVFLVKTTSIAEAGVFHIDDEIYFPEDKGGIKDAIVIIKTEAEFDEKRNDYKVVKEYKNFYKWNGSVLMREER